MRQERPQLGAGGVGAKQERMCFELLSPSVWGILPSSWAFAILTLFIFLSISPVTSKDSAPTKSRY